MAPCCVPGSYPLRSLASIRDTIETIGRVIFRSSHNSGDMRRWGGVWENRTIGTKKPAGSFN